jgi:EAL domain-containing protein (putative c-di-GMP-specific phosphodiesterase class I)
VYALIVDDDAVARRLAAGVLRAIGCEPVFEATDGVEGLAYLRRDVTPVDVVICDLDMDGMDGVEFLSELGAERPGMAVVLASGMHRSIMAAVEEVARSSGLRVLGVIDKPVDRQRLGKMLEPVKQGTTSAGANAIDESFTHDEIRQGLNDRQFVLYYQPKVDLRDGKLVGAEALARWNHPERGLVPPMSFIPAAEQSGLINELTWTLFDSGLRTAAEWQSEGRDITLSVNITVGFLEELAVTENIMALTQSQKVMPDRIVLEITESTATTDVVPVIGNLARLRMRGFGLAIDDFGTGYSTMQQLSRIPFNELKVDRTFIAGATQQADVRAILESSVELGRRLRLQTTAEGIETLDELSLLRSIGCDTAQGFLFAKPMEPSAFRAWADEWDRGGQHALRQLVSQQAMH